MWFDMIDIDMILETYQKKKQSYQCGEVLWLNGVFYEILLKVWLVIYYLFKS